MAGDDDDDDGDCLGKGPEKALKQQFGCSSQRGTTPICRHLLFFLLLRAAEELKSDGLLDVKKPSHCFISWLSALDSQKTQIVLLRAH